MLVWFDSLVFCNDLPQEKTLTYLKYAAAIFALPCVFSQHAYFQMLSSFTLAFADVELSDVSWVGMRAWRDP